MQTLRFSKAIFTAAVLSIAFSCTKKKDEPQPTVDPEQPAAAPIAYDSLFRDASGAKTVDFTEGHLLHLMMFDLSSYASKANADTVNSLDSTVLKNKFANLNSPFTTLPNGFTAYTINQLNSSPYSLRSVTGVSASNPELVRTQIEGFLSKQAEASKVLKASAQPGVAGKARTKPNAQGNISTYLLDENGVEQAQMIQKSLIGAFQYDYIGNVLLSDESTDGTNNVQNVAGKNYTELQHKWDVAYGVLTTNNHYAKNATDANSGGERYLGAYLREYGNSAYGNDYLKIHPAFLAGREALTKNDRTEAKKQALIIRSAMERVIARAAVGYLNRWMANNTNDPAAASHQISEGLGFIYSLRFCKIHGADAQFSDQLLNDIVYNNTNGLWGLTNAKATAAANAIKAKFGI